METKVMRWSKTAIRLLLGGLFICAGTLKALAPGAFLKDIANYQILPQTVAFLVALYLPYLEILCGMSLLLKRFYLGALGLLGGLMLVFIVALISAWARGLNIECGCFGSGGEPLPYSLTLARDVALLTALLFLGWRSGQK